MILLIVSLRTQVEVRFEYRLRVIPPQRISLKRTQRRVLEKTIKTQEEKPLHINAFKLDIRCMKPASFQYDH
jgi:hypothetical protein